MCLVGARGGRRRSSLRNANVGAGLWEDAGIAGKSLSLQVDDLHPLLILIIR